MIALERNKNKKWIFQKNVSSSKQIKAYIEALDTIRDVDKAEIQESLREKGVYAGRSIDGSLSTMGVRFSQMCFYMFGYKSSKNIFIPTQSTINILKGVNDVSKNMLVNLFAIQYPHPYSNTVTEFKIYAGRLIIKLLTEKRIEQKLYADEFVWFLLFLKEINESSYDDLVNSIIEYRKLSFNTKKQLFINSDSDDLFANCFHEVNYYFFRIFEGLGVFETIIDPFHNDGNLFSFKHGLGETYRNDSIISGKKKTGYIRLRPQLVNSAIDLINKYSPFDVPTSMGDVGVFSKKEWIEDLYENDFIKYLNVVFPEYTKQREIIEALSTMTHMSKFGSLDGKDFEKSLKPVFELFREVLNVEIISGAGDTDLLCAVEDLDKNIYKINVDGKSRKSSNSLKATRLVNHLKINGSRYCIVVAPRFSKNIEIDIGNLPIVALTAESLSRYLSKECLSNADSLADYIEINRIISENLGVNITKSVDSLTEDKYGFVAK